jgi:hypothetical protein
MQGSNGFDPEASAGFIRRLAKLEDDHASERGSLMKALKDDKEALFDEAVAAGFNKKLLKLEHARRKNEAKIQEKIDDLDEDERDQMDLFQSAVARGFGEDGEWVSAGDAAAEVVEKAGKKASTRKAKEKAVKITVEAEGGAQVDLEDSVRAATERDLAEADEIEFPGITSGRDEVTA